MATIRLARPADAATMPAIYAPFVLETAVSFAAEPPSVADFAGRVQSMSARMPWLVGEVDGQIAVHASAVPHRPRAAYQWSVEATVYVGASHGGRGLGSLLYRNLFDILALQGYRNVYGGITLPNEASVRLHEATGFTPLGV